MTIIYLTISSQMDIQVAPNFSPSFCFLFFKFLFKKIGCCIEYSCFCMHLFLFVSIFIGYFVRSEISKVNTFKNLKDAAILITSSSWG